MGDESVICKHNRYYWLFIILAAPLVGLCCTAWFVAPICLLIGIKPGLEGVIIIAIALAIGYALLAYYESCTRLRFEVNERAIILGGYRCRTVIPISEISSAVIGLPDRIAWWIRLARFLPTSAFHTVLLQRRQTILLRLSEQRLLPICLRAYPWYKRSDEFTEYLLSLVSDKIVSCETYSEAESTALCRMMRLNRIIRLPE